MHMLDVVEMFGIPILLLWVSIALMRSAWRYSKYIKKEHADVDGIHHIMIVASVVSLFCAVGTAFSSLVQ